MYGAEVSTTADKIKPIWLNYESSFFLFRLAILFVKQYLCLLSERTTLLEHYIFNCHLLQVSAEFGHHHVDFTTYMENTEVEVVFALAMNTGLKRACVGLG